MILSQARFQLPVFVILLGLGALVGCNGEPRPSTPSADPDESASAQTEPDGTKPAANADGTDEDQPEMSDSDGGQGDVAAGSQASGEGVGALYSPEAFLMAAHDGKRRIVEICLESGFDINLANPQGVTPLAMAAYNGHDEVVTLLINKGATIDSRDNKGMTPLIHAASGEYPSTVELLLDAGADIDAVDGGEKFTALMMAAALGNVEVVKVLLQRGADKTKTDIDGESAADFALNGNHLEIVKLLQQ